MMLDRSAVRLLAASTPSPTPAKGGEGVKSGPIGLAVILVLCVAVYFLFKSMSKHLRRVREEFPEPPPRQIGGSSTTPQPPPKPLRRPQPTRRRGQSGGPPGGL